MFDSYCLNLNPMEQPAPDPVERIRAMIRLIEYQNQLPPGILHKRHDSGEPLRTYGDKSLSQLRTAIVYHVKNRAGIADKHISGALSINKSTLHWHKKTARDLIDTGNESFKLYLSMVQGIAV